MSWDDLKLFLEIAHCGTLTAAATGLKLSQPTAGRRLRALEDEVGAALFQRTSGGLRLTDVGQSMLLHAEQMADAVVAMERKVAGEARGLEGNIRLSTSDWIASRILAPRLGTFAADHPGLTIEIIADSRLLDLQRREADLAFRFVPFSGTDIVQKRFARIRYGLYAAPAYLERCGDPLATPDGAGHQLVTMDSALDKLVDVAWLHQRWPAARPSFRSNNREAQGAACAAGAGLAVLPRAIGDELPLYHFEQETPPTRDLWFGYHEDLRGLHRMRMLLEHLTATLPALL